MQKIGYQFLDATLLQHALTHRSFDGAHNYERLEFLGDALLGLIVAEYLFDAHQTVDEGALSRMRATLVNQEALVQVAQKLALYRHLVLGGGELKGGGRMRPSILADVVEAMIAAIYLDCHDFTTVKTCVLAWYGDLLNTPATVQKDAKSRLQEWLQGRQKPLPHYDLLGVVGNSPDEIFTVRCAVDVAGVVAVTERASSRRIAEQKCALLMLNRLLLLEQ